MPIITSNLGEHFRDATGAGGSPGSRRLAKSAHVYKIGSSSGLTGPGLGQNSSVNLRTTSPEIRNPLLNLINFYLPYDRKTLNQWIRYYARFDPYVGNCVDLHGEFPISDFHFTGISDPGVLRLYEDLKEDTNQLQFCFESSREFELLGECYSFWNWDEDNARWSDYTILNPDLLDVKLLNWGSGAKAVYTLEPSQELKELVRDRDPRVMEALEETLDPVVLENVLAGRRIPLSDFNVLSMVRRESPYESRGTSIIQRCLKALMYKDKLVEAQYCIADQQVTPVQLWKIGDAASGYMPTDEDLEHFRQVLIEGRHDQLFTLVTHGAVNLDLIGYTGKLLNIIPEMDWVHEQILVGMFANKALITGEGPTYTNAYVAFKAIQGRYQSKRDKLVDNFRRKIYTPFAEANQIFDTTPAQLSHRVRSGKRQVLIPGIEWNFKLDLTDQTQRLQYAMQLRDKLGLPAKTVFEMLDLPYEPAKEALKAEEGSVFDPVYQSVRQKRADQSGMVPSMGGGEEMGGGASMGGGAPVAPSAPGPEAGGEAEPEFDADAWGEA